jgi:hypothetical protein
MLDLFWSSAICGSPWEEKVNTAFFRGTATGGGTKIENNQRLKLANLHHVWYVQKISRVSQTQCAMAH